MKIVKTVFILVCCSYLFISCEKEIDLDLDEADQLFVIEGIVHDSLGDNFVLISKTRPFDNNDPSEKVSQASVQISDGVGGVYTLSEVDTIPGYYTDSSLTGIAGRKYDLNVNIDGNIITASSVMSPRIQIDSLSFREAPNFGGENPDFTVFCHFTDPLNIVNYYRMKSFLDDEQLIAYVNWDDDAIDGVSTGLPVYNGTYNLGEEATVQLLSVDEANFRYFTALELSQEGEVPGNPVSNLSGDKAVGYFGAYAKSEATITIMP